MAEKHFLVSGGIRVLLVVLEPLDERNSSLRCQLVAWSIEGELGHGVAGETHASHASNSRIAANNWNKAWG